MRLETNPFARTRDDHRSELAEDYVELIHRLEGGGEEGVRTVDLVQALDVAQPTVTKALDRLQREGLVRIEPRSRIYLTRQGRAVAEASLARHRTIVRFLEVIGVPPDQAELDAEGIEHHVSEVTLRAMERFVDA